ncbi:MAG TPA: TolC family protein [Burkholderiaceae bacterium]|nr:TolC family protein [Burkholderiaceae bacterium]
MTTVHTLTRAFKPTVLAGAATLFLAACGSIKPVPLTPSEVSARVKADKVEMYKEQQPITGPITYADALARSLKYNLDHRLKLMETALARGLHDVSAADMLPKLVAEAGYARRNNDSGGTSVGIEDRVISLRPSTSEERAHHFARATFSWNALDFGLSYYRAKQSADEVNIAEERRRKILQNIALDLRQAYWRALGAQQLVGEADELATRVAQALEKSREAERAGVLPPQQGLAYQRALLDTLSVINLKRQEMQFAKREIAALMNLPAGADFTLAGPPADLQPPKLLDLDRLEQAALEQRPELREEDYRARIGVLEAKRQIVSLFPNLNVFVGPRYDSNAYLYNDRWVDAGVNVSMNLLRLAAYPAIQRTNEARTKADEARRLALSMAVLTQVRVSVERYKLAVEDQELAAESSRVDQRLASIARASERNRLESELEALRTEARALMARFQHLTSQASLQASYARVLNTVGIDVLPDSIDSHDLAAVASAIDAKAAQAASQVFAPSASAPVARPVVVLTLKGMPQGVNALVVRAAVVRVLERNGIAVAAAGMASPMELAMAFEATPTQTATRAQWSLDVSGSGVSQPLARKYTSFLARDSNDKALSAFAEAAALSLISDLRRLSAGALVKASS